MVKVIFTTDKDSGTIALRLTGHAGSADAGQDVICASCSILAYTVAQTAKFMYDEGNLRKKPNIKLNEGDALIRVKPKDTAYVEALHTFFVAQVGYSLLAHNFPQYVELTSFGKSSEED